VFTCEPVHIPRNQLPPAQLDPDTAYQVVHDELMLVRSRAGHARTAQNPSLHGARTWSSEAPRSR
jgi:hypothetical protein